MWPFRSLCARLFTQRCVEHRFVTEDPVGLSAERCIWTCANCPAVGRVVRDPSGVRRIVEAR